MYDEHLPVDVYCYYRIDLAKLNDYCALARQLQEKFLFRPECLLYQFRRGFEDQRRDTMMECGTFNDLQTYRLMRTDLENRNTVLFAKLDRIILGGLAARRFEIFHAL